MNTNIVLTGVFVLIANLFVLFTGAYNYNFNIFVGVLAAGVVVAAAGAFARPQKPAPVK
jgi:hypothetical protein